MYICMLAKSPLPLLLKNLNKFVVHFACDSLKDLITRWKNQLNFLWWFILGVKYVKTLYSSYIRVVDKLVNIVLVNIVTSPTGSLNITVLTSLSTTVYGCLFHWGTISSTFFFKKPCKSFLHIYFDNCLITNSCVLIRGCYSKFVTGHYHIMILTGKNSILQVN